MRGDSLRDFYAKALALAGLGALASIGALVDYWPGAVDVPRVTGIINRVPAPAVARRAEFLPVLNVPAARRDARTHQANSPVAVLEPVPTFEAELVADSAVPGAAISLTSLISAGPDRFDVTPVDESDLPSSEIRLSVPARSSVDLEDHRPMLVAMPAAPAVAASTSDGITGVFRKTGSSIAMVGIKTGSTIVGAFRAVGGAFRKIL